MRMQGTAAALALGLSTGAAWAQEGTVPVSVEGTVVEVPSDIAAAACGLDDDQLEAAIGAAGEGVTATEVETAATTTGTTDDVTAAGETDDDDAGSDDVAGDDDADDGGSGDGSDEVAGDDDGADDDADDVETADASAGATPLCEISREEATAQGIELP